MCSSRLYQPFLHTLFVVAVCSAARADVTPAPLFCDHAVLQQGRPVPVWGTAAPGEAVSVSYQGQQHDTTADARGDWSVCLEPLHAGQAGKLEIKGKNTLSFEDVVAGEVWLCSGQSNMEFKVKEVKDSAREIADAQHPQIRQFLVSRKGSVQPEPSASIKSKWQLCTPQAVPDFTAVGYFFARDINRDIDVPVGLIDSTWGGTPIAPWMSQASLDSDPSALALLREQKKKEMDEWPAKKAKDDAAIKQWEADSAQAKTEGKPAPKKPWYPGSPASFQYTPTGLYNGMIHPLLPYAIRGALWYQGESNAESGAAGAKQYAELQPLLVKGWRDAWKEGDFPFYFVQLPNWDLGAKRDPSGETWSLFREAQAKSIAAQPRVAMAVTIDVGASDNIHPTDKQPVGHRLALLAEAQVYGKQFDGTSPSYQAMKVEGGDRVRVSFDHAADGLSVHGDKLEGFTVAGEDGKFVPAEARVDGSSVVVSSPQVASPAAVRYAWGNNPMGSNLYSQAGLPAAPFRSDDH